jgi:hypothetical protein
MGPTLRMIANLTGAIVSKIRVRFGVVPAMTFTKVLARSDAVGSLILRSPQRRARRAREHQQSRTPAGPAH